MKGFRIRFLLFLISCFIGAGCANIVPPAGGKKDVKPPKLVSVDPPDSMLNTRVNKIEMHFNEFINVSNAAAEVQVSPLLPFPLNVVAVGKRVTVKIPDSLLQTNTTYRVSFGKSIRDLHEDNPFKEYTYTFSTGSYFDSLLLNGVVIDAATGLPDSGVIISLYNASKSDSVVVRERPVYISHTVAGGAFSIKGLPGRSFRIYALKDGNNNLMYDGGNEKIAFIDSVVIPVDSEGAPIVLKTFMEETHDTALQKKPSVVKQNGIKSRKSEATASGDGLLYTVAVDTADKKKRTVDVTKPLVITFNKAFDSIRSNRIYLSYDSAGISVEAAFTADTDTVKKEVLLLHTAWKENALYTLRLLKGFVKDTAGNEPMPSKFIFRTKNDDDYGKLQVNIPAKYKSNKYLLMIVHDKDTIYQKPVADTIVRLNKLQPGGYGMRIIADENENGKWDTGDLFEKRQPELVIPFTGELQLKAGWENVMDFETKKRSKGDIKGMSDDGSPQKRDKADRN